MATLNKNAITDAKRLATLVRLALLDSAPEIAFDRLTQMAAQILSAPTALVSLVDSDRQFFKSAVGVGEPWASLRETPLSYSFCQHTVTTGQPLIITDARLNPLVKDSPAIPEMGVIAYAGIPLRAPNGEVMGSFCVVDTVPRHWQDREISILKELASIVMTEIALRDEVLERQRAERGLRETKDKYTALFDQSLDAAYIVDFKGQFLDANNAALQMLGYSKPELLSLKLATLLSPDQFSQAESVLKELRTTGLQQSVSEWRLSTKNGDEIFVETLSSVIHRDGEAWAIQGIARDVTERKQAELALRNAYEREKEMSEMRSRFMAMISHDFRTPLTVIKTSSEIVKNYAGRITEAKKEGYLNQISNQVGNLIEMLDDVLAVSKGEIDGFKLKPERIEWVAFCRNMVAEAQLMAKESHEILFQCNGLTNIIGMADLFLMRRAILNLLSNAIKYSPDGGKVIFEIQYEKNQVILHIQDEGIGISEEDQQHLYETFYRASNVGSINGTGLGLAIVKQVIEAHDGTIEVQSQLGEGTCFTITVPVH